MQDKPVLNSMYGRTLNHNETLVRDDAWSQLGACRENYAQLVHEIERNCS